MTLKFRKTIIVFILLISGHFSFAQPTPPGDPGPDPDTVPISGIEVLIGAGALLGGKRILDSRKTKK
jgi:hypothetical protein